MPEPFTADESAKWITWKRAAETVMAGVGDSIAQAAGISTSDFSVLTRLVEEGAGSLRQQRLADQLGWERSRLSRHLGRMEARGLIVRRTNGAERQITASEDGRAVVTQARLAHADAVRRLLFDQIPPAERDDFWATVSRIAHDDRRR